VVRSVDFERWKKIWTENCKLDLSEWHSMILTKVISVAGWTQRGLRLFGESRHRMVGNSLECGYGGGVDTFTPSSMYLAFILLIKLVKIL
jgi:hypothetical protein